VNGDEPARVLRTGIALVHEGELIAPAPGSEASFAATADESGVHYHFPVEIEIRTARVGADPAVAVATALAALADHLGG
jgi:hypothetical protein